MGEIVYLNVYHNEVTYLGAHITKCTHLYFLYLMSNLNNYVYYRLS